MRKHLTLLAAATLSAGSFAFLSTNTFAEDLRATGSVNVGSDKASASASTNLPQGITRSDLSDNKGIQQTLAGATSAAIEGSGLSRLQMYLTQSDWSRLNQAMGQNRNQQLTQALDQFKQAWKAKYNKDFDIQDNAQVVFGNQFSNFQIVQGEISNPALLSNWPVDATNKSSTEFKSSTDTQNRSSTDTQYRSSTTTDRNISGSTTTDRNTTSTGSGVDENRIRATVGGASSPPAEVTPEGQGRGTQTDRNSAASGSISTDHSSASGSASASVQPGSSSSTYQRSSSTYDRTSGSGSTGTSASASGSVGTSGSTSGTYTGTASGSSSITGKNLERGMNVAIVTFPASHGAPELTVSLVREGSAGASGSINTGSSNLSGSTSGSSSLDRSSTPGSSSDLNARGSANIGGSSASGSANVGGNTSSGTASGSLDRSSSTGGTASGSLDRSTGAASGSIDTGTTGTSGTASSNVGGAAGMSNWKIDLPDTVTADKIQSNLAEHLNHIVQMKDQLPADQNEAYRMVAHHVMMALYDVPESGRSNSNQSTPNQGSSYQSSPNTSGTTR